jgi:hypothetical protein
MAVFNTAKRRRKSKTGDKLGSAMARSARFVNSSWKGLYKVREGKKKPEQQTHKAAHNL